MIAAPHLDWTAVTPELITGGAAILVLLIGLGKTVFWNRAVSIVALVALAASFGFSWAQFDNASLGAWVQQINSDSFAQMGRMLATGAGFVAVLMSFGLVQRDRVGEYHALLLAAVCGMGMFSAGASFVTLFVGLELFSIALYVLCAIDVNRATSLEAGLKYLIIGGLASAIFLYGLALVYGATGSFELEAIGAQKHGGALIFTGLAMVIAALTFKASAAPLHWWTPDVYTGAPTPITAFMAVGTKAVAFVALTRVLVTSFPADAHVWVPVIAALATISIVVGNLGALMQNELKRMLAYSSVAHAGYLLIGLVGWRFVGVAALLYALVVYAIMTLGAFALVYMRERALGRPATFDDLRGTGWGNGALPMLSALPGIAMTIVMLSLAGIPPTAGFFGKLLLFGGAVQADYAWLAVVGALGSVISLGYYLRVPVAMYLQSAVVLVEGTAALELDAVASAVTGRESGRERGGRSVPALAALGVVFAIGVIVFGLAPRLVLDRACDVRSSLLIGYTDITCGPVDASG
ncbi:MAG: NADH-quinone oxidoreductase subunit N [Thermoleophilia bacterium]|nr:NADH-quinone oxidoreductase subunit N [Thermoleophilia bacterium]